MNDTTLNLHPLEVKLLAAVGNTEFSLESLATSTTLAPAQLNQALSFVRQHQLVEELQNIQQLLFVPTAKAAECQRMGLPERRILDYLHQSGECTLQQLMKTLHMDQAEVGSAFGRLAREKLVIRQEGGVLVPAPAGGTNYVDQLEQLIAQAVSKSEIDYHDLDAAQQRLITEHSKKRGAAAALFRRVERQLISYRLNKVGLKLQTKLRTAGIDGSEVGALTSEMLRDGHWKTHRFREYNVFVPPSRVLLGRPSPYAEYLRWVKDKLVALGFEEFDGPLVETEFWNCDALYMPQFHSARDTHDGYRVAEPQYAHTLDAALLQQVAATHEHGATSGSRGWRYRFDRQFTKRLILRSQGTALSAKQLPTARVPGKYFGVVRCFRYDQVDATHLADFYQTEGIILGEEVNLRTLLGLLKLFAEEIAGASEVRYVPGYFPFTEPSIEVHIKHPTLGWFELGGSGIFRPEVTIPLGVEVPVLAWGLGIDRMALMKLGLSDLRDLFTLDIEKVRLQV